jgi:SAM-dependent methyltransferase
MMGSLDMLLAQPKLKILKMATDARFTVLDVGSGNASVSKMKRMYPNCIYHGVDRVTDYSAADGGSQRMDRFFQIDLESGTGLDDIPAGYYDVIIIAHVVEHLRNGLEVVAALLPKLKSGGCIYIEFPSARSLSLPSMRGCLNFSDDPTHVRVYDVREFANVLLDNGCRIVRGGRRRDWAKIVLLPFLMARSAMQKGGLQASVFWDLLGFADYIYARKV